MAAAIRSAWRTEGALETIEDRIDEVNEPVAEAIKEEEGNALGEPVETKEPIFHAKAYAIAAHLDHELKGKELDFDVLSRDLPELMKFVQARFGVNKLPGTFEKFKGYSYKTILKDRSGAKKGQLKMPLLYIGDYPEMFGEAVAVRAGEILNQHFK